MRRESDGKEDGDCVSDGLLAGISLRGVCCCCCLRAAVAGRARYVYAAQVRCEGPGGPVVRVASRAVRIGGAGQPNNTGTGGGTVPSNR
jgi:hypothetical protein